MVNLSDLKYVNLEGVVFESRRSGVKNKQTKMKKLVFGVILCTKCDVGSCVCVYVCAHNHFEKHGTSDYNDLEKTRQDKMDKKRITTKVEYFN